MAPNNENQTSIITLLPLDPSVASLPFRSSPLTSMVPLWSLSRLPGAFPGASDQLMLLAIDQFSVAAMSPTALLLLLLSDLLQFVSTSSLPMRLKCGDNSISGAFESNPDLAKTYEPWPNNIDYCSSSGPETPSYYVCSQCNIVCLANISRSHLIIAKKGQNFQGVTFKAPLFLYTDSGSGLRGNCEAGVDQGGETSSTDALRSFSKTSVLFVSISFIILMVISLAWLVFYYVQRFRYAHAKDRLQRRLFNAARKALTRIQTRTLRAGEAILDTDCAVCIDPYQIADVVRELPCKHVYHKSCIDPWLLEHRTCPMCKADIVKHFGYHLTGNEGNRLEEGGPRNAESPEPPSSGSESAAFPYQGGTVHDFHFTPTTSPQLVMSSSTAKSFAIVPLTVHSKTLPVTVTTTTEVEQAGPSSRSERVVSVGQLDNATVRHTSARPVTQGQVVNLIQVRARAQSCTRSVPLRRAERPATSRPAPIDTNQVV